MVDLKCEISEKCGQNILFSSDFDDKFFGYDSDDIPKKSFYPYAVEREPIPMRVLNLKKYPGPVGEAPDGRCRGAKPPEKKISTFFHRNYFFSKVKKKVFEIVRYVPKNIFIEIRRKKNILVIFLHDFHKEI